jgi:hypothetical protein
MTVDARAALFFLPLGIAIGPKGLKLLPESLLSFLDPAVCAATAAIGALAGLELYRDRRRAPAWLESSAIDAASTVVAMCAAAVVLRNMFSPSAAPIAALCLAVAAVASSPAGGDSSNPSDLLILRVARFNNTTAIIAGGVLLAWLSRRSPGGALTMLVEVSAIAAMMAAAGWLLARQTSDDNEQRVFAAGTVLLLGGAADYIAASALAMGLVAGACWRAAGGEAQDRLARDIRNLQRPLVVALLLIAGAKCQFAPEALGIAAAYAVCRIAGKVLAGFLIGRLAAVRRPLDFGFRIVPPGVVGIGFVLSVAAAWRDSAAAQLVDAVVLGSLVSALLAVASPARQRA